MTNHCVKNPSLYSAKVKGTTKDTAISALQDVLRVYMDLTYKVSGGANCHSCALTYGSIHVSATAESPWDAIAQACQDLQNRKDPREAAREGLLICPYDTRG